MTESESGGNLKYAIIGLLLLGGAGAAYFLTQSEPPPPPPAPPPAEPKRDTSLAQQEIEIPEEEPDAGPTEQPKPKIVYKYVNAEWSCAGQIDPAKARSVIAENNRQIRACYERALKNNNQLQGKATLTLRVDKSGGVSAARAQGSLKDEQVFSCMRQVAETWKFAEPAGGACAVVQAPYNFTPQQ